MKNIHGSFFYYYYETTKGCSSKINLSVFSMYSGLIHISSVCLLENISEQTIMKANSAEGSGGRLCQYYVINFTPHRALISASSKSWMSCSTEELQRSTIFLCIFICCLLAPEIQKVSLFFNRDLVACWPTVLMKILTMNILLRTPFP